jgi:hypothetical protein
MATSFIKINGNGIWVNDRWSETFADLLIEEFTIWKELVDDIVFLNYLNHLKNVSKGYYHGYVHFEIESCFKEIRFNEIILNMIENIISNCVCRSSKSKHLYEDIMLKRFVRVDYNRMVFFLTAMKYLIKGELSYSAGDVIDYNHWEV